MAAEVADVLSEQQLVDAVHCVQLAVSQRVEEFEPSVVDQTEADEVDCGNGEPDIKRARLGLEVDAEVTIDQSVKQILFNINKAICLRLDGIENKLEMIQNQTKTLENKVDQLLMMKLNSNNGLLASAANRRNAVIVGLPDESSQDRVGIQGLNSMDHNIQNLGPNVTLITLNNEDDYPNGCWLGDETNPEMRVRAPITPSDLIHVHSNCRTSEKMALTLLDYLFDRDTQSSSNLSGMGKHGKKQLDPLMIYGIRCHLIHKFGITENDWHRIKQNVDSKCRTAFRRKQRGMPLTVKSFRGKAPPTYMHVPTNSADDMSSHSEDDSLDNTDTALHIHQGDIQSTVAALQGEGIPHGGIQILHATPEQISQLQHAQHIQILQGDHVLGQLQDSDALQTLSVTMAQQEGIHVSTLTTESGEVLQIQHCNATN